MNVSQISINKTFQSKDKNSRPQLRGLASSALSGTVMGGALYVFEYLAAKQENKALSKSAIAQKALFLPVCVGAVSAVMNASGIGESVKNKKNISLSFKDRVANIGILSVIGLGLVSGVETLANSSSTFLNGLKKYSLPAMGVTLSSIACAFVADWSPKDKE